MDKPVALGVAAFLDSPEAAVLSPEARAVARPLVERVLEACYQDLGKEPRLLDDQDLLAILTEGLPARLRAKDARAEHATEVLGAWLAHLETSQVVAHAWELRRALDESAGELQRVVASGALAGRATRKPETVTHVAPKLGRNDPCSCGSGKKYKKCHGKGA